LSLFLPFPKPPWSPEHPNRHANRTQFLILSSLVLKL